VNGERCMYCGNCYTMCSGMPLADPKGDGIPIWVGGKVSNTRSGPAFSRLAIPFLPNHPPR
jgi:sulfite reductase beta subunit